MRNGNKILAVLAVVVAIVAAGFYLYRDNMNIGSNNSTNNVGNTDNIGNNSDEKGGSDQQSVNVSNFDECIAAGYEVAESYPRQCKTPDGKSFTEDIGNELEKTDLIRISSPRPNDTIKSPLKITGEARGFWFNEASFPIKIYGADGKELGTAIASAKSDWMTEEFVPFEVTLTFEAPKGGKGTLVLQKDNPSGLPKNDDSLKVPVKFESEN
jgi:hypothetical protein